MLGWAFRIGIFKDTHFIIEKQIIYKKNMRGIDKKNRKKQYAMVSTAPKMLCSGFNIFFFYTFFLN